MNKSLSFASMPAFAAAVLLSTLFANETLAQSDADRPNESGVDVTDSGMLPGIVVSGRIDTGYRAETATTATRIAEPLLDTPRSISVITPELLRDRKILDPQDALTDVAGVAPSASVNGFGEDFLIRGFRQEDIFKDSFRDGRTNAIGFSATGPTDVANLERIEVLKGPAGILFGRGEPGGIVNYITKTPFFGNSFGLEQDFASYDFYRTQLDANWAAVPGRLALRLDAAYTTGGSFTDFVFNQSYFVAPAILWVLSPSTTITFRGEYANDRGLNNPGLPYVDGHVLPGVPYNRYLGEPAVTDYQINTFRGLLTLEQRWTDDIITTLSVNGRKSHNDTRYVNLGSFDGSSGIDPVTGLVSREFVDADPDSYNIDVRLDQVFNWTVYQGHQSPSTGSKDGKVQSHGDDPAPLFTDGFPTVENQLLISAEYEREVDNTTSFYDMLPPLNAFNPHYTGNDLLPVIDGFPLNLREDFDISANSYSMLFIDRISIGHTIYLSGGARFEWFEANQKDDFPSGLLGPGTDNNTHQFTINPSAGIVIKPTRGSSLYFSYAESTNSFDNLGAITSSGATVDPERARAYEVGAKLDLLGGRLLGTAALFEITKENVVAPDPANPVFSVNSGEQRSQGLELELKGEIVPGWRVSLNYAYTDSRIISAPGGVNVGHPFFGTPYNSGGFFTTLEFQKGPLKGFGFGGGMFFSDRVQVTNNNTGTLSGWAQTNLVAYYHRGLFRVQINVKNLFDNEFYYARNDFLSVQPAQARTIIGSIRCEF
jgi:iron complex outermembrane recepter protein